MSQEQETDDQLLREALLEQIKDLPKLELPNGVFVYRKHNITMFALNTTAMKAITSKRTGKTEDDLIELGNIETEAKLYFDDELGVYVPTRWLTEAICRGAFAVIKTGKDKMRGGIFATEEKAKLTYKDMNKVKTITDVVMNPTFRHRALLPQGQVRVPKDFPIFKNWSFETSVEFDDTVVDFAGLKRVVDRTAMYVGFGDFRFLTSLACTGRKEKHKNQ
jgi:hypothetical protein